VSQTYSLMMGVDRAPRALPWASGVKPLQGLDFWLQLEFGNQTRTGMVLIFRIAKLLFYLFRIPYLSGMVTFLSSILHFLHLPLFALSILQWSQE
jgi:hypothetical protein